MGAGQQGGMGGGSPAQGSIAPGQTPFVPGWDANAVYGNPLGFMQAMGTPMGLMGNPNLSPSGGPFGGQPMGGQPPSQPPMPMGAPMQKPGWGVAPPSNPQTQFSQFGGFNQGASSNGINTNLLARMAMGLA